MIYDGHPELQSKWNKSFWAHGYYVEVIGTITDKAVQRHIKEKAEELGTQASTDAGFEGYQGKSVQDFRFALSDGIRDLVIFATFEKSLKNRKKQRLSLAY